MDGNQLLIGLVAVLLVVFLVPLVRRNLVTRFVMNFLGPNLPKLGDTEKIALEAGTVWFDGELFSGSPNWKSLLDFEINSLTEEEQAFLDGPVEEFCKMCSDYEIVQAGQLPEKAFEFLKEKGFLGMIIHKEYGGLGFSARAHSAVVTKIGSRSATAAVTVMVPNSLGPAELLQHYGTKEQKDHYLPRLAKGEEIPCFGLTEPNAGSDAGSLSSRGVVCKGTFEGEEVLGMRLNWSKRYITLAPIATLIGLAFRLEDPDGLLGDKKDLGITCALIPSNLPGVKVGERHDPLGVPFHNGPTYGEDVFVPLSYIIGGPERAGEGWRMLMDCLAAGRSISLPASACGGAMLTTRTAGAYATVREQFKLPIGRFEGVEERLARIAGYTYFMNATRDLTAASVDAGEKPSVLSAIVKAYMTEGLRVVVNDGMDVVAGAGICRGPRNIVGAAYQGAPIGITVEGANILTRSMIIFGQGAIRCHPFVQDELKGVEENDLALFDRAFWGHVLYVFKNLFRAKFRALTGSYLISTPLDGHSGRYLQHLTRMSSAFCTLSEFSMAFLQGALKRKEKLTGRMADALSWMYIAAAAIKRFEDDGRRKEDLPYLQYSCDYALFEIQEALLGVLENFPVRPVAWLLGWIIFPLGARFRPPTDRVGGKVARAILEGGDMRDRLTKDMFVPDTDEPGLGELEACLKTVLAARPVEKKLRDAMRSKKLRKGRLTAVLDEAIEAGVITAEEKELLGKAEEARYSAITVDAFETKEYHALRG